MGDLSKHFSLYETRCKCNFCTVTQAEPIVNMHLVTLLELISTHCEERYCAKVKTIVNSWNRCRKHNDKSGGAKDSRHLVPNHGDAADIRVYYFNEHNCWQQVSPDIIGDIVDDLFPDNYGVGIYADGNFTHVDVRPGKPWRKGFMRGVV